MSRLIIERQRGDYEAVSVLHAAVKLSSPAHNNSKWSSCKQLIISLSPTQGLKLRSGVVASHREWRISYFFSVISLHNFYCQNKFHMQKFFSFFDSFVSKDVKIVRYKRIRGTYQDLLIPAWLYLFLLCFYLNTFSSIVLRTQFIRVLIKLLQISKGFQT